MSPKQNLFVSEYLRSGNATKAAMAAGYSARTAYSQGQRLLKHVEIARVLQQHTETIMEQTKITVEDVVRRINHLADNAKDDYAKLKALDMLMKHLGAYITPAEMVDRLSDEQLNELAERIIKTPAQ